ncbi:MAG: phage holin family protein [Acidaminococcaceae bacterium]|nr:phage holin family protein [Acidaminococcaceae bacterium]
MGTFLATEVLQLHVHLLGLFTLLVIFDLLTKWAALGHKYLNENDHADDSGAEKHHISECILAIPRAREAGIISSSEMKHRFSGKIIVYLLLVIVASTADLMLVRLGKPSMLVSLAVGYLAVTEVLSAVENLQDAGVEACADLNTFIRNKTGMGGPRK